MVLLLFCVSLSLSKAFRGAVAKTTSTLFLFLSVQFDFGGSGAPSTIHQVEAFSVLIHLGLVIARC
ncbi:hypothetical protein CR513_61146 [Mucuna pruriens]|uniref:Secreted protein n=1 Tax=Mucuna pruriens TaxID=157652 RepID=A0A371E3T1_MUCPR|nr:hypothetical protein CR513_61146 [Mucuna pruriens]